MTMKVRDAIRMIEADGWYLDRIVGSHRQYRHPTKPGTVTISGNLGKELKAGTPGKHSASGRFEVSDVSDYLIIIEGDGDDYSGYVPELPGCVAAGDSPQEVEQLLREAIPLHLESLRQHGEPIPVPSHTTVRYVSVAS
jgi:predicted RNase H-like HicB family nuclease/predicted RNA binding protein YcfA (HicA-like mRNA interferase family)